ncbi:MAG: hypothetical protein L7U87_03990 [Chlamydiales bacterium]|nr:hypothetical protein [Chlamydiales bacterium]
MFESFAAFACVTFFLSVSIFTRKVWLSLLATSLLSTLLISSFNLFEVLSLLSHRVIENLEINRLSSDPLKGWNIYVCLFLWLICLFYKFMKRSGAIHVYANYMQNKVKSSRRAELVSLFFSCCFAFDDYLSTLTVGTMMQSVTDKFKVSRLKLAYLVSSMASSLVVLLPLSSWFAAFTSLFRESGIQSILSSKTIIMENPIHAYIMAIPYMAYPILSIITILYVVLRGISFGWMGVYEKVAKEGGCTKSKCLSLEKRDRRLKAFEKNQNNCSFSDFLLPIAFFIISAFLALYFSADGFSMLSDPFWETKQPSSAFNLCVAAFCSCLFTLLFYLIRGVINLENTLTAFRRSIRLSILPMTSILFSWVLGDILSIDLHLGKALAKVLNYNLSLYVYPLLLFFLAFFLTLSTGSAWSTGAVLIPLFLSALSEMLPSEQVRTLDINGYILPSLGAICSGTVLGGQLSPASETTIMTATAVRVNIVDHILSQLTYVFPVFLATCLVYLLLSFINIPNTIFYYFLFIFVALCLIIAYLEIMNTYRKLKIKSILE